VLIVAIGLVLETDFGAVKSRCLTDGPPLVNPATVVGDCQRRRQQTSKGPVNPVFNDVAALRRLGEVGVIGGDGFVGDGWIVESHGADKVPIASDSVRVRQISADENKSYRDRGPQHGCIGCRRTVFLQPQKGPAQNFKLSRMPFQCGA